MNSKITEIYNQKLITAHEAAKFVKSGDKIFLGEFAQNVEAFESALALRKNELSQVIIMTTTRTKPLKCVEADPQRKSFIWDDWHFSGLARKLSEKGLASYKPFTYHQGPQAVINYEVVDLVVLQVTPMDRNGFFNFSTSCSMSSAYTQKGKRIILEINTKAPRCLGGMGESIHVSQVDGIIEGPNNPLVELPEIKKTADDLKIAEHIMSLMEDGATLQLGIGGLPNTVGSLIAKSDLRDLGVHTEMLADSYVDMYEAGKISGRRKKIDIGKMVYTFAMGTQKLYEFVNDNPVCETFPASYTNDPTVIAQNDKVMAINNALEIDLFSQVASEASGTRQISGTGGQLDFMLGAFKSNGGKGLICLNSTYKDKSGNMKSRIVPYFSQGTIVTCPRSLTHYVVTEFGIAQMKGKSVWQRAEALIEIAHPQFKDELVKKADELGVWKRSHRLDL